MITHLEPDILVCEVKWALGSITTNKASGGEGIPVELFQILKDDAVKVLHSIYMLLLLLLSHFSRVRLCATPETAAHQLPHPWDSPGKNIGVGCHFLLQCMKVRSESEVAQSCPTLSDPMDCSLSSSSIHGIFLARVLGGVPLPSPYSGILTHINSPSDYSQCLFSPKLTE